MNVKETIEKPIEKLFEDVKRCQKWVRILLVGLTVLLLVSVAVIITLAVTREKPEETVSEPLTAWPEVALTEGVLPFSGGTIQSVSVTDGVVRVFYEGVTLTDVKKYLSDSGLSFSKEQPYLASLDDRLVILTGNGDGEFSLVIAACGSEGNTESGAK